MALEILLDRDLSEDERWRALHGLATEANEVPKGEVVCPACGDAGPHDDNGSLGWDRAFSCRACGCHFDLAPMS